MDRRHFLRTGLAAAPALTVAGRLFAAPPDTPRFLCVFLRGGYDCANFLIPYSSSFYYDSRPKIAIAKPDPALTDGALALDADWALTPAVRASLGPLYQQRQALFIPFAGTEDLSRSHFETQDSIELGQAVQSQRNFRSGFLARLAGTLNGAAPIAFTDTLPLSFQGDAGIASISLSRVGKSPFDAAQTQALRSMYTGNRLESAVTEGLELQQQVAQAMQDEMQAANRGAISTKGFELTAERMARFMRSQYRLGFVDVGGWDTHVNEGGAHGALAGNLTSLASGLATFAQTLGEEWNNTVVFVLSEFGRTFRENGNAGTDHGHGSVYWVLGERITGLFLLIEVVALLLVCALGVVHLQPDVLRLLVHPATVRHGAWVGVGLGAVALASTSASWALSGSSQALFFSEDMRKPNTVGRIMMLCLLFTVILETAPVIGTIIGSHDLRSVLAADAPFEYFLGQYLPAFGMKLVSVAIAVAIFNAALAGFVGIGRNVFSMGRTGLFSPAINRALMRVIPRTDAPWVAILLVGAATALVTPLSMTIKIMLLSGGLTISTCFYVWGAFAGRRSGRTGQRGYRMPAYPLIPLVGILIVVGEGVAQWIDKDVGRPALGIMLVAYTSGYLYYRLVLMRRPGGWRLVGPQDIDAQAAVPVPQGAASLATR